MKPSRLFWLWVLAGFFAMSLTDLTPSLAQNAPRSLSRLPAPPPVRNVNKSSNPSSQLNPKTTPIQFKPKPVPVQLPPVASSSSSPVREYVFQSPAAKADSSPIKPNPIKPNPITPPPVTVIPKKNQSVTPVRELSGLYRVEVSGESESVLVKVRTVEPLAFIRVGEGAIYAGLFAQHKLAQQRVQELTNKGLSAKVVKVEDKGIQKNVPSQRLVNR